LEIFHFLKVCFQVSDFQTEQKPQEWMSVTHFYNCTHLTAIAWHAFTADKNPVGKS